MTPEEARELFDYDPETGLLRWRRNVSRWRAGQIAGTVKPKKDRTTYVHVRYAGKWFSAHRLAYAVVEGRWPNPFIDHINGDGTDNRWSNLREATASQNARNRKTPRTNSTGVRGVVAVTRFGKVGYEARIKVNGKAIELGRFKTKQEAAAAYLRGQEQHHGEFAPNAKRN
jgi:hypothetical protein